MSDREDDSQWEYAEARATEEEEEAREREAFDVNLEGHISAYGDGVAAGRAVSSSAAMLAPSAPTAHSTLWLEWPGVRSQREPRPKGGATGALGRRMMLPGVL
jgi:hypothetical protein